LAIERAFRPDERSRTPALVRRTRTATQSNGGHEGACKPNRGVNVYAIANAGRTAVMSPSTYGELFGARIGVNAALAQLVNDIAGQAGAVFLDQVGQLRTGQALAGLAFRGCSFEDRNSPSKRSS
jgi:hypothetical protein